LSEQVAACTRCEALSKCRTQTVFGEGNVTPRVVFFGEAPGRDEDLSGRPFVGKAGQLLTKMIKACQFQREDVYILNTVKCRPPNNRNPEPTEVENCREYFEAQLNLLRPEYIVCLGLVSAQALLRTKLSVGKMRGRFHNHFDSKVIVTYHPSYLLRNPAAKKAAWEDLQIMLRDAGLIERQKNSS
jgi:DNA polymerase